MKLLLSIILTLTATVALGGVYKDYKKQWPKVKWPDCYCTDKTGARVELGTMVCMKVDHRDFIARCEMSLNNPMWREIKQGCLSSGNQASDQANPLLHAPFVDA
ncbi:MAG: hypothetical protein QM492_05275 [Rhodobacterales bacterium]